VYHSYWNFLDLVTAEVKSFKSRICRATEHPYAGDSIHVEQKLFQVWHVHRNFWNLSQLVAVQVDVCQTWEVDIISLGCREECLELVLVQIQSLKVDKRRQN